jgi:hypothetical protein
MRHAVRPSEDMGRGYQHVGKNITQGRPDIHEALDVMREYDPANDQVLSLFLACMYIYGL